MAAFLGGYALVWSAFGLLAFGLDAGLHAAVDAIPWLHRHEWAIGGSVLALAGALQFTTFKDACIDKYRHPAQFVTRLLREQAYEEGRATFDLLAIEPTFRDFVCMYIGEGSKRSRNTVAICNSDPCVVQLGAAWITKLTRNKVGYSLQYHADQQLDELVAFWAGRLDIGVDESSCSGSRTAIA